jgi:hypothetical protein
LSADTKELEVAFGHRLLLPGARAFLPEVAGLDDRIRLRTEHPVAARKVLDVPEVKHALKALLEIASRVELFPGGVALSLRYQSVGDVRDGVDRAQVLREALDASGLMPPDEQGEEAFTQFEAKARTASNLALFARVRRTAKRQAALLLGLSALTIVNALYTFRGYGEILRPLHLAVASLGIWGGVDVLRRSLRCPHCRQLPKLTELWPTLGAFTCPRCTGEWL